MNVEEKKKESVEINMDEEGSVVEMLRALSREYPDDDVELHRAWLCDYLRAEAESGALGFCVDEFGAREVYEIEKNQGLAMLDETSTWDPESDTMLHPFYLDESHT